MPISVKVFTGPEFDKTRVELLGQAKALQRRTTAAVKRAVDRVYPPAVKSMLPEFMPDRYAGVLERNLKFSTSVSYAGQGVSVTITAPTGGPQGRDVTALENRGVLAHPLFGDKRHWYRQRITRGFASKPLKAVRKRLVDEVDKELAKVANDVRRA